MLHDISCNHALFKIKWAIYLLNLTIGQCPKNLLNYACCHECKIPHQYGRQRDPHKYNMTLTCQIVTIIILKHATMTILGGNQLIYICNDFSLFFSVFIYIHEYANYANVIRCIFDHGMKGLCLSFILVQIVVITTKSS